MLRFTSKLANFYLVVIWKYVQNHTRAGVLALAYLHTIHSTLWKSRSTLSSSGLVLGKIRSCRRGSFNWVLSRKSHSVAAFIFCHFTNCVCVCLCLSLCVCISLSAGKQGVFSHKVVCTCLYMPAWFWVGNEFQGAAQRNCGCLWVPPLLRLRQCLCALFLMICELLYVCVQMCVLFVCCFYLCLDALSQPQVYWPQCPLLSLIPRAVSYPTDFFSCVLHGFPFNLASLVFRHLPGRSSAVVFLEAPSRSCLLSLSLSLSPPLCAFDTLGHFEVARAPLKHFSLFLFLSGQTDTTVWGCVEFHAAGERWHRSDMERLVMRLLKYR